MKSVIHVSPVFTPGLAGQGTLDFTGLGVDVRDIHSVINLSRGAVPIYANFPGLGALQIAPGPVITLSRDTVGFAPTDLLTVIGESSVSGGGGGSSVDRELVVTKYRVKTAFAGASVGDIIAATQVLDVSATPAPVAVFWQNQTTFADLATAPSSANLTVLETDSANQAAQTAALQTIRDNQGPQTTALQAIQARAENIDADIGSLTDAEALENGSMIGLLKRLRTLLGSLDTKAPTPLSGRIPIAPREQTTWSTSFTRSNPSGFSSGDISLVYKSAGFTNSQSNGNAVIVSSVAANEELLAISNRSFSGSFIARGKTILSNRIANTNFAVLLADRIGDSLAVTVNSATSITVAVPGHAFTAENVGQSMNVGAVQGVNGVPGRYAIASVVPGVSINFTVSGWPATGTGTVSLFGWNYYRNLYTGATPTAANVDAQRYGFASGDTVAAINTTAAPGHMWQMTADGRNFYFDDALTASSTAPAVATRAHRFENLPDADVPLFVYLWAFNGPTAPASAITWTIGFLSVEEFPNQCFFIAGQRQQGQHAAAPVALTQALPAGANTIGAVNLAANQTLGTLTTLTSGNLGIPGIIADVASAALAATATTAAFTPTFGTSYEVVIPVTAMTGTAPTLDVGVEESDDSGTNWFRVYDFPRITGTGIYRSPKLALTGNRIRYVQTLGGATPSFTRSISRLQSSDTTATIRQQFDRVVSLTTLGATTVALNVQNCRNAQLVLRLGAATTPPALQLDGTDDNGLSWYPIGSPLTGVASSTVQLTVNNVQSQQIRARVATAGTGVTPDYVLLKGF